MIRIRRSCETNAEGGTPISITVRPLEERDHESWRGLYRGYAEFYRQPQTEAQSRRVWSWLMDPAHEVKGIVAVDGGATLVGLAHYRPFARPLDATIGCFLDDLFVASEARGGGAADALLGHLRALARENGWSVVRWITSEDNYRARSKYDQVATRTRWVTYDMHPD